SPSRRPDNHRAGGGWMRGNGSHPASAVCGTDVCPARAGNTGQCAQTPIPLECIMKFASAIKQDFGIDDAEIAMAIEIILDSIFETFDVLAGAIVVFSDRCG